MPTDKIRSNRLNFPPCKVQAKQKVDESTYNEDCDEVGYYELSILPPPHSHSAGSFFVIPCPCIGIQLNHIILRCVLSICVVFVILHLVQHSKVIQSNQKSSGNTILIWNEDEVLAGWNHLQCGCMVTSNRDYNKGSIDAVVVYSHRPYSLLGLETIRHTPDYLVVFAATNPLSLAQNPLYAHGDSFFNFTMSYRLDSDLIWTNYYFSTHSREGKRVQMFDPEEQISMDELPIKVQFKLRQQLMKKQFQVLYMMYEVNDYTLPESLYLEELRKYIDIDAYVSCYGYQE